MKHTIIATSIIITAILFSFFYRPANNQVKNFNRATKSSALAARDSYIRIERIYKNNFNTSAYGRNRISRCQNKIYDAIPYTSYKRSYSNYISGSRLSYINYQPIFADEIKMNYRTTMLPFEKNKMSYDDIVETGIKQYVDFGNNNDLPNNPSTPIQNGSVPLLLCIIGEIWHLRHKSQA